jgi:REP element-mobilizing transposase RayT
MARPNRTDEPGMIHHVTLRGVGGMDVFRDDVDRRRFLALAARYSRAGGARCLAWALMDNHVHLVVQTGWRPLSEVVHGFAFRYAQFFNWRHARPGHVFQNRFGSEHVDSDEYLRTAIAYVHLNPVRAGMVRDIEALAAHRWTSFAGLVGAHRDRLVDANDVLALFADDAGDARRGVVELTRSCLGEAERDPSWHWRGRDRRGRRKPTRLESQAEMTARLDELERARAEREAADLRAARLRREGWTVDAVIAAVCAYQRVQPRQLLSRGRTRPVSHARALVAYLAADELHVPCAEIARRLVLSDTAVLAARTRGAALARLDGLTLGAGALARA